MAHRLQRRNALITGLAASIAVPARAAARRKLDFGNPVDLIYAQIKMDGDLRDHVEVIGTMDGIVHAIFDDGKTMEPMFRAGSLAFTRTYKVDDTSYRSMSNFTICYMDLQTGEVLESWYNPWLKRTVKVVNYASTLHTLVRPMRTINRDAKVRVEWTVDGDNVIRWSDAVIVKPNPITPEKWPKASVGATYYKNQSAQVIARLDELEDEKRTSVDAVSFGQRHGPWYPWQEMGQAPGRTYRRDVSRKAARLEDVRGPIPAYAAKHFPDYMHAPKEWTGVYMDPETLWAETMPPETGGTTK